MPSPSKNIEQQFSGLWSLVLTNSAVVAAILYISGWVYLYYFFKSFNIDVSQLELTWSDVLVYSAVLVRDAVHKIFSSAWFFAIVAIALLLAATNRCGISFDRVSDKIGRVNALYFIPLLLSFIFISGIISYARHVGLQAANAVRVASGNYVTVQWAKDCEFKDAEFAVLNARGVLKPLFSTPKWIYLYAQTGEWEPNRSSISVVRVIQIPASCISAMDLTVRPSN
jgi:hypothetical protein